MLLSLQLNLRGKRSRNISENIWNPRVPLGLDRISQSSIRHPSHFFGVELWMVNIFHFQVKKTVRHNDLLMEESVALLWWCQQQDRGQHPSTPMGLWPLMSYATLHAIPGSERRLCNKNKMFCFHYCGFTVWRYQKYFFTIFSKWQCIPKIALATLDLSHILIKPILAYCPNEWGEVVQKDKLRSWFVWKGKWVFTLMTIFSWKTEDNTFPSWVTHTYFN